MKNFIKKIFFIILVILVGSCAKESKMKNSTYSNLFKSGTTIVYEVASWGDMYILKIEIEKINGDLIFRYTLSDENGDTTFQDREITVSKKSLESSEKIFMNLWDGDIVDIKGKTSIFFSKKVFRELVNKSEVTIDVGDGEELLKYEGKKVYTCIVDGKIFELNSINASSDLFGYFSILEDYYFPLILQMEVGYIIELKEIVTR